MDFPDRKIMRDFNSKQGYVLSWLKIVLSINALF